MTVNLRQFVYHYPSCWPIQIRGVMTTGKSFNQNSPMALGYEILIMGRVLVQETGSEPLYYRRVSVSHYPSFIKRANACLCFCWQVEKVKLREMQNPHPRLQARQTKVDRPSPQSPDEVVADQSKGRERQLSLISPWVSQGCPISP
jgi:hypothetical protein